MFKVLVAIFLLVIITDHVYPHSLRVNRVVRDLDTLSVLLCEYKNDHGQYPDQKTGFNALLEVGAIVQLPLDPWGRDYICLLYTSPSPRDS